MNILNRIRKPSSDYIHLIENKYVILPESMLKFNWDMLIMTTLLAIGIFLPIEIAFLNDYPNFSDYSSKLVLSIFLTDIFFNLNTGFYKEGELIKTRTEIFKHYLQFSLWIDIFSVLPFDKIFSSVFGNSPFTLKLVSGQNFNLLRAFTLLKLIRLMRLSFIFMRIEDRMLTKTSLLILKLTKIFFYLLFVANSAACLMYLVSLLNYEPGCFISQIENSQNHFVEKPEELYVFCLYWAITTMVSIGYGDFSPRNTPERITGIIVMNFSSITFGYLLGNIGNVISKHTVKSKERREMVVNMNKMFKLHKMSNQLRKKTIKHLNYHFSQSKNKIGMRNLLEVLSLPLREEIFSHINGSIVKSFPLFTLLHTSCVARLSRVLQPQINSPKDFIFREKSESFEMYFITKGCVEICDEQTGSSIKILSVGCYFGEIGFFLNRSRCASVFSISFVETLFLTKDDLKFVSLQYPELQKKMEEVKNLEFDEDLSLLFVECYLCKAIGHVAKNCYRMTKEQINQRRWLNSRKESQVIRKKRFKLKNSYQREEKLFKVKKIYCKNVWGKKRKIFELYPRENMLKRASRQYLDDGNTLGVDIYSPRLSLFSRDSEVSSFMRNYFNYDAILNSESEELDDHKKIDPRFSSFDTTLLGTSSNL